MRKRTTYTLLAAVALLCALAIAVYLRGKAPPETARLLPESDAIVYANLQAIRAATHFDRNPISPNAYRPFIDATGILPERDLDSVAVAMHRLPNASGPNGAAAFSVVMEGRFNRVRLANYLASVASTQESYAGHIIYDIPSEGRTVRTAILGYDTVATSNAPTPEQIHSILDRQRAAASPFAGSSLLEARFRDVPAFSTAWAIGSIGIPFAPSGRITVLGLELPLRSDATFVASLRYTHTLELRIDELTSSPEETERSAQSLNGLLNLFRGLQAAQQPVPRTASDRALRKVLDSASITGHKDRVTLLAQIPAGTLQPFADAR